MHQRICIFGDSITWGILDDEKGGWVNRLKIDLMNRDKPISIYNLGISANNSEHVLQRFEQEARARRCTKLVFAVGINDSKFLVKENRHHISLKNYEENLRQIIKKSREMVSDIIFIGLTRVDESKTTPIAWDANTHYMNASITEYDAKLEQVCKEQSLTYVPMFDVLKSEHLPDGVHPDAVGHRLMLERIREVI